MSVVRIDAQPAGQGYKRHSIGCSARLLVHVLTLVQSADMAHIETVPKALSDQEVEKGRCDILLPEIVAHPRGNDCRKPEGFLQNPQVS